MNGNLKVIVANLALVNTVLLRLDNNKSSARSLERQSKSLYFLFPSLQFAHFLIKIEPFSEKAAKETTVKSQGNPVLQIIRFIFSISLA